jgi:hypothetical protein
MKKSEREARRVRAEARKQNARSNERATKEKNEKLEEGARNALVNHAATWDERQLKYLDAGPRYLIQALLKGAGRRLLCTETKSALSRLGKVDHLRPVSDWKVQGKGRESVFRSLCEHLLAKYPTPRFLWSAFEESEQNAALLVPLVVHVAGGGSLFQYCKSSRVPFTLTRSECLEFMKTTADVGIVSALRRVQVKSEGGDNQLYEVWRNIERNKTLNTAAEEAFSLTVLRFFARNPMLSRVQIGPLCDYVFGRFRQNPAFSMQGRTVEALTRAMEEWHRELGIERGGAGRRRFWFERDEPPCTFEKSGFRAHRVEKEDRQAARNGFTNVIVYTIQEVLTSEALRDEGRKLHHCVYSYRSEIVAKTKSIWSLSVADELTAAEKLVTIEVSNKTRAVVQARGACNRKTSPQEDRIIIEWAGKNGLTVSYGKLW